MYDQFAHDYAAHAATAPYNALYDRPAVLSLVGDVAGRTVLDAGCGPGLHAEALQQRGAHVIGFDQSPTLIEVARQRVAGTADLRVHDLAEPWHWITDDSIDVAVLALVLHYIDDRPAVLRELVRVLRRSGYSSGVHDASHERLAAAAAPTSTSRPSRSPSVHITTGQSAPGGAR